MKSGVQGKVLEPTVEQITAALRLCAVDEPAETYPCEQCYLYPYSKDGRMSTGRTCFEHLALDTCQLINRLNDFQNSQCAKLLARITELDSQLTAERARYAELQRYNVDCTKQCDALLVEKIDLMDQFAESQRRERAAVEDSTLRKGMELTPIYTCGGHGGYCDDDDEDFWCPICHSHLGTHKGFKITCPRCGQRVNHDSEPLYNYRDMRESEAEWRGLQEAGKGETK